MSAFRVILETVLATSVNVLVVCLIGAYLYKSEYINANFTKKLSGLVERVFLPSLILTNIIKNVSIENLIELFPIILSSALVCVIGLLVGILSNKFWIKDEKFRYLIALACANPHTTNIQLQVSYGLQYLLNDASVYQGLNFKVEAGSRSIIYIMLFTAISNTFRWTFGKHLLLKFSQEEIVRKNIKDVELKNIDDNNQIANFQRVTTPFLSENQLKKNQSSFESFKHMLSMPLISIFIAFSIVFIPQLQITLINPKGFIYNSLFTPISTLGKATTPCVLIILGSTLFEIIQRGGYREDQGGMSSNTLIKLTFTKLIILPSIGLIILYVFCLLDFLYDPAAIFVAFFTFACPSAINIVVQAKQYTQSEETVSMILVYSYISAILTLPFWSVLIFNIFFSFQL